MVSLHLTGEYIRIQDTNASEDHCIEVLRQGVMCRGDISLVTIRWQESNRLPVADFTAPHECVNFDAINEWARERRINAMQPGLLVHPTLGMVSDQPNTDAVLTFFSS